MNETERVIGYYNDVVLETPSRVCRVRRPLVTLPMKLKLFVSAELIKSPGPSYMKRALGPATWSASFQQHSRWSHHITYNDS